MCKLLLIINIHFVIFVSDLVQLFDLIFLGSSLRAEVYNPYFIKLPFSENIHRENNILSIIVYFTATSIVVVYL